MSPAFRFAATSWSATPWKKRTVAPAANTWIAAGWLPTLNATNVGRIEIAAAF
jgi:hypothetical protein